MSMRCDTDPGVRRWLLGTTGGLLVWASSFVVLYGGHALGCEAGWQARLLAGTSGLTVALAAAWAAHLLALAALLWWVMRWPATGMLAPLSRTLTVVAIVATVWTGWPVLALPPCAGQTMAGAPHEETACSRT